MHFRTLLGLGLARASVKLSAAFFHDESSITIGGGGKGGGCRKKKFSDCKQDVDLYKTFLDKITKLLDIHAVKKLSHKEKKSPSKPWLTYFHP